MSLAEQVAELEKSDKAKEKKIKLLEAEVENYRKTEILLTSTIQGVTALLAVANKAIKALDDKA